MGSRSWLYQNAILCSLIGMWCCLGPSHSLVTSRTRTNLSRFGLPTFQPLRGITTFGTLQPTKRDASACCAGWALRASVTDDDAHTLLGQDDPHEDHPLFATAHGQRLVSHHRQPILEHLYKAGLWIPPQDAKPTNRNANDNTHQDDMPLLLVAQDFVDRPEVFSSVLMSDFQFPPLVAHQTRALAMALLQQQQQQDANNDKLLKPPTDEGAALPQPDDVPVREEEVPTNDGTFQSNPEGSNNNNTTTPDTESNKFNNQAFHATIVNPKAQKRRRRIGNGNVPSSDPSSPMPNNNNHNNTKTGTDSSSSDYTYGLPRDYEHRYPTLANELDDFYKFMTLPNTHSQEDPIRPATAKIYLRHAKLFLGWWCASSYNQNHTKHSDVDRDPPLDFVSLHDIVPSSDKESATVIIDFVLWLRGREVSVSYEANLLRGLIKLLKFRFAQESTCQDGRHTFEDIELIQECRKLHRNANRRQRLAPRSSDEQKKWITWPEYLRVIEQTKQELLQLLDEYHKLPPSKHKFSTKATVQPQQYSLEQKRVAEAYQRYLILAIFASIPDRQRTIRELEVGRTLLKDSTTGDWMVKHGPEDYKTGKHYGERPALHLAAELTPALDDFVQHWRPCLEPLTNCLLVQSRTGKPMTSDSIFQRVSRSCFKVTGRKVNPHLLRDILVTHVRGETNASEQELEALALYMGHSVAMQRSNYDRRTLTAKVAPAVQLMQSVNQQTKQP